MMFDRMRVYDAGRFHDVDLPDWYHEAQSLSQTERFDWHCALERVLDCEYTLLTEDCTASTGLEIRFWPSERNGILVLIEDPLGLVEQVVILNPTDWLPFLTRYLAPPDCHLDAECPAADAGQDRQHPDRLGAPRRRQPCRSRDGVEPDRPRQ